MADDKGNILDLMQRMAAMPLTGPAMGDAVHDMKALNDDFSKRMQAGDDAVTEILKELVTDVRRLREHAVDIALLNPEKYEIESPEELIRVALQTINFEVKVAQRIASGTGPWE